MSELTDLQTRIMWMVAAGKSNAEIATELQYAEGSIRNQLNTLYSISMIDGNNKSVQRVRLVLWWQGRYTPERPENQPRAT